jgi:hypothetical protein
MKLRIVFEQYRPPVDGRPRQVSGILLDGVYGKNALH